MFEGRKNFSEKKKQNLLKNIVTYFAIFWQHYFLLFCYRTKPFFRLANCLVRSMEKGTK